MNHPMRRSKQALDKATCQALLDQTTCGVLALNGEDGYPYGVPLSFVREGDTLLFHCATSGHKLECIRRDSRACFTVIVDDDVVPERFTTRYRSVIAQGTVSIIEDDDERRRTLEVLGQRYAPGDVTGINAEIAGAFTHVTMLRMDVEHLSGKQSSELAKESAQ